MQGEGLEDSFFFPSLLVLGEFLLALNIMGASLVRTSLCQLSTMPVSSGSSSSAAK